MIRFDAYEDILRVCRKIFIGEVHFRDGFRWEEQFGTDNRALIIANHGPFIGPFVWVMALYPRIIDMGFGHLTYSAIAHPIIRNIPLFARMVGFEKRGGKRLKVEDYVELFNSGRLNILSVAPEGEYTLWGNGVDIQPFRSARSLEIALRADCRIILAVGKGFEKWQRTIPIGKRWQKGLFRRLALMIPFTDKLDERAMEDAQQLSISGIFGRIPDFHVATEIFEPELTAAELAEDRETRDRQLREEAARVRRQMIRMLEDLRKVA